MTIIDSIIERARTDKKRIVLPEGSDIRVVQAARMIVEQGIAYVILVGNKDTIMKSSEGLDLSKIILVDPASSEKMDLFAQTFYDLRKSKGVTLEQAYQTMLDPVFFGTMMVKLGEADGLVSGAIHSTADTLRPALQIIKTASDAKLVSSFFIMVVPNCDYGENGVFLYSDCGLVENPDAEQLSEIAVASGRTMKNLLEITPRIAMLSYSTYGSAKSELTEKVVKAVSLAKQKAPDLLIDGEMQVDAALVPTVAKMKAPDSQVAGSANILIFPDLNSGNICYKITERLAKAEAYGPITQGLAKPINDLSRGCKAEDIVGVVAITAVQAQMCK